MKLEAVDQACDNTEAKDIVKLSNNLRFSVVFEETEWAKAVSYALEREPRVEFSGKLTIELKLLHTYIRTLRSS